MATATNTLTQRATANPGSVRSVTGFTRPANTTAYAAHDVIYEDVSGGCLEFDSCGGAGTIIHVGVQMFDVEAVDLDLLVFDAEPTNMADNAAVAMVSSDINKLVGVFSLTSANKKIGSTGLSLYETTDGRSMCYTSDNGALYGILVTRTSFTPASATAYSAFLHLQIDDV
tara:strand:- start:1265 stop:1777 length:513 start_codon:yes stop_codon:yes gene_type:complete